jgi:hypothetical protein
VKDELHCHNLCGIARQTYLGEKSDFVKHSFQCCGTGNIPQQNVLIEGCRQIIEDASKVFHIRCIPFANWPSVGFCFESMANVHVGCHSLHTPLNLPNVGTSKNSSTLLSTTLFGNEYHSSWTIVFIPFICTVYYTTLEAAASSCCDFD